MSASVSLPAGVLDLGVLAHLKYTETYYSNEYTCNKLPRDRVDDFLKGEALRSCCSFICKEKHDLKKVISNSQASSFISIISKVYGNF